MKPHIRKNSNLRTIATNDFKKDVFKLMNNSGFGKTMENIRNRMNITLVKSEEKAIKMNSLPNYEKRNLQQEPGSSSHEEDKADIQ